MPFIGQRKPIEIAAQLWCLSQHQHKVMDVALAQSIAEEIEKEQKLTDSWYETARTHCINEEFYRETVQEIGKMLPGSYISDDGSVQDKPLALKVAGEVRKLVEIKRQYDESNK